MIRSGVARVSFLVAPAGFLGGWLLMRPIGGGLEPGFWWTSAHVVWLVGFVAFIPVGLALRTLARPSVIADLAGVAVVLSAVANIVQMGVDLVVGFQAGSRDELRAGLAGFRSLPAVEPLVYSVGAQLIFVALLVLAVLLAWRRTVPMPPPVALAAGIVLLGVAMIAGRNTGVMPAAMTVMGLGLAGIAFGGPGEHPKTERVDAGAVPPSST
ncbi:hypothetical protein [Pseudonocardia sp. TRM90224]|uniref:hypothetical protein n=1 Tax=Pseudonocardia sp. TRM90224 TaxID=2812678 RepID=UPI001E5C0A98|nr:hypothetical protein [Pseudonocardia sp. TRM90224]